MKIAGTVSDKKKKSVDNILKTVGVLKLEEAEEEEC